MMNSLPNLLLVDDEPTNLQVLRNILQDDYRLLFARNGQKALELAEQEKPDLILLDVMMPGMTGLEVCRSLKQQPATSKIPVIFVTALSDADDEATGFEAGAVDYISKPVSPAVVKARVKTHLSLVRAEELEKTRLQIIHKLGKAAEYKDNETGMHVIRMSHFARHLAQAAGCDGVFVEQLFEAAPMHDIGKIGIPDAVLLKPGKLDADEWKIMQSHVDIGAEILGDDDSSLLQMAASIARNHHEKWDGSGYPRGIRGEQIPLEARIVAIADVFDALTSVRPYKSAWTMEEAFALIRKDAGSHFDPVLAELFLTLEAQIRAVQIRWAD
ncbi:two-component system response regulator [Pseudoduganella danionis]|uniref:Response regulator n=1 Tax=Pseudoduganella danionis TaxID=1890295 RepID=A0ABW9SSA6_9BURK|nr:two-component system response regulator [Pseudoduganella danionis]MTW34459.1 response regulator [Pseudoduganella danionis]